MPGRGGDSREGGCRALSRFIIRTITLGASLGLDEPELPDRRSSRLRLSPVTLPPRRLIATGLAASAFPLPALNQSAARPVFIHGVQSGDVDTESGMIWTRIDRPSRVTIDYSTTESFSPIRFASSPLDALPSSDFAVKCALEDLPADQDIFYRFTAADLDDINRVSEPIVGRFRTAPFASAPSASSGPATPPARVGASTMSA